MTVLPIRLPDGSVLRESDGQRLCRCRRRMPRRFARQFACSPKCHCAVSFQGPRRSVLSSGLWDLADGLVWGKTAVGTFAGPTFNENAAESRSLTRWLTAKRAPAASVECTT